jgi:uncharacterized tellurite resistance protein B-like protein
MEFFIFIIIVGVFLWLSNVNSPDPPVMANSLRIKIFRKQHNDGQVSLNLLEIKMLGVFPQFIHNPEFRFRMVDSTPHSTAKGKPILSCITTFQRGNSKNLDVRIALGDSIFAGSGADDWITLGSVPSEVLVFPEKGPRTVKLVLDLVDLADDTLVLTAETAFAITAPSGYLQEENDESEAHAASLQLAMCIAAEDGEVHDLEVEVIKAWGDKSVYTLSGRAQTQRREILNKALKDVTNKLHNNESVAVFDGASAVLNSLEESRYKFEAYELCLKVLQADGIAHPMEMLHVAKMARTLNLDEARVRILTDRYTSNVSFAEVAGAEVDDDAHLGILPEMSKEEVRKHLNKLFKKYSARATHDDPEIAEKAKGWLEKVGNARARHIS